MQPTDTLHRSRSDPFFVGFVALLFIALPAMSFAQQAATNASNTPGPIARTAVLVVTTPDVPDAPVTAATAAPAEPAPREAFFSEPRLIRKAVSFVDRASGEGGRAKNGFYPEFSNMITGAGWISAGPGYRHWLFGNQAIADVSTSVSWRFYKMAQGRLEFPNLANDHLSIGSQLLWRDATQITYFGVGPDTPEESRSEYRMKTADLVGYTTVRPNGWLSIGGKLGWLRRPELSDPAGSFKRGNPSVLDTFPGDVAFSRVDQPNYIHGEASITADTRDSRSYPTSGGVYRGAWTTYVDRDGGMFSFRQYEAEAAQFVPVAGGRVVLAAHAWIVASDTTDARQVPFYLMPALGGGNFMRSYTDFRFHDRNMAVVNVESRFALTSHLDLAAFIDAGNVAAKVGDLNFDKRAYGAGVRIHTATTTFGRLDVTHGEDGWRFLVRTSDPLHLSRLSRHTAAAPFVQ